MKNILSSLVKTLLTAASVVALTAAHASAAVEEILYTFPNDVYTPTLSFAAGKFYLNTANGHGTEFMWQVTPSGDVTQLFSIQNLDIQYPPILNPALFAFDRLYFGIGAFKPPKTGGEIYVSNLQGHARILYAFKAKPPTEDGGGPIGGLTVLGNVLYGTTSSGGRCAAGNTSRYCGTIFRLTALGAEQVVWRFEGGPTDGASPTGGLIAMGGYLFGTTSKGGAQGLGTIFVAKPGAERLLHSFAASEGSQPRSLINVGGTLYGTLNSGPAGNCVIYKTSPTGADAGNFTPVYTFTKPTRDCQIVYDGNGTIYGITKVSGRSDTGMVFSLSIATGALTTVYSFGGHTSHGQYPNGIIYAGGAIYGTTSVGGNGTGVFFRLSSLQ